jgi:hypothetical protein
MGWLLGRFYILTGSVPPLIIYLLMLSNDYIRLMGLWPCLALTVALLAFFEWPRVAVSLQGRLETLLAQPFMEGAIAVGASSRQIYRQHLRPYLLPLMLQVGAQELARALLVVGQLGVFGIMSGGGVLADLTGIRNEVISGVPEWGATLAEGRKYARIAPWMVLAPGLAFFATIAGANWLALGLEGGALPLTRWQEATTGRLSARWRWLALPAALLVLLWQFQGLPWGQDRQLQAVVEAQLAALERGDVAAYMQTVDPADPDYQHNRQAWASTITAQDFIQRVGAVRAVDVDGARGQVLMNLVPPGTAPQVGRGAPPRSRLVRYERRWGRWYEVDEDWAVQPGYHTTLLSKLNLYDPTLGGQGNRITLSGLAVSADRAYERLAEFMSLPDTPRQTVILFADHDTFRASLPESGKGALAWYAPDRKAILVSPEFLVKWDRSRFETVLSFELAKALAPTETHWSPLTMGLLIRKADVRPVYRPDYRVMAGAPSLDYAELFARPLSELPAAEQETLAVQSALLVEFLRERYPALDIERLARDGAGPADLEQATGTSTATLSAAWGEYLFASIAGESVMAGPLGKDRVPAAVQAWAAARGAVILDMASPNEFYVLERVDGHIRVVLASPPR